MRISDWSSDVCSSDLLWKSELEYAAMLPQPAAPDNHTDCHTSRSEHDRARLPPLRQLVPTQNRCERPFARIPIDHRPVRSKYDIIIISNDSEGNMVETGDRKRTTLNSSHYCAT